MQEIGSLIITLEEPPNKHIAGIMQSQIWLPPELGEPEKCIEHYMYKSNFI